MKSKSKRKNAKGAGRPEKAYERLPTLRSPAGTTAALDARRQGKETRGETLARLLGVEVAGLKN